MKNLEDLDNKYIVKKYIVVIGGPAPATGRPAVYLSELRYSSLVVIHVISSLTSASENTRQFWTKYGQTNRTKPLAHAENHIFPPNNS